MGLLDAIENFFKAAGVTIDIDDLFVVERSAPRDESELFDEERERLKDLRVRRDDLQNPTGQLISDIEAEMADKAADLGVDANMIHHVRMVIREKLRRLNRDDYWFLESHKWQTGSTIGKINQLKDLYSEIKKIGKEIHGILYNEPGVLPTTIYNTKEILERFNTIEQPKIETILDSISPLVNDIDDLFVVERSAPRDESELFDEERERLKDLRVRRDDLQNPTGQLISDIEAEMADRAADRGVDANMIHHVRMVIREKLRRLNEDDYRWFRRHSWCTGSPSLVGKINQLKDLYSEIKKIDKEIHGILYNEPGVLPTTIYNTKEILERFNTIEQPKIETTLDSINDNLIESKKAINNVNATFERVIGFVDKHNLLFKISLGVVGIGIAITLILILILIIRMILFGL